MNLRFLVPVVYALSSIAAPQTVVPAAPRNGGDFSSNASGSKVPTGVILVKGAWSSASDSTTPLPEGGTMRDNLYANDYFGISYPMPTGWTEIYKGPPPSESGRYVLAQLSPTETTKGTRGIVLITAQDMFFNPQPAANALELVTYSRDHLQSDYKVEIPPSATKVADHPFTFFAYWSPVAQLHWYVLATEIRCHAVEIVLSSQDTKLLEHLVVDMDHMNLPAEANPSAGTGGGQSPVCIKDYATDENLITRVEPVFAQRRFNPVPVRIIIDKTGSVKHIHFLSAFPDQAKVVTDALRQWKFKPYMQGGRPVEVETGILFGSPQFPARLKSSASAVE